MHVEEEGETAEGRRGVREVEWEKCNGESTGVRDEREKASQ